VENPERAGWGRIVAAIDLDHVSRHFADGTVAVDSLTLGVEDGELLVIVGPSGSGKSTVLRMIAGLEDVSAGTIRIGTRVVNDLAPRDRDVAMVFQNYALYPHMTVAENMAFALELRRMPARDIRRRVDAAAGMLGIRDLLDRRPRQLSGGERQRVAMGRAIVREPAAFLMDEPLSNLDARLRVQMRTEIARLQQRLGTTTLYVTHDQTEAMTMGDRVAVMRDGVLQQVDRPQTLYDRPRNLFVGAFIGSPAMNVVAARLEGSAGGRGDATRATFGSHSVPLPQTMLDRCPGLGGFVGREVILGVRPEDITDADTTAAPAATLTARVAVAEPMGAEVVVHVDVDGGPPGSDAVEGRPGDSVRFAARLSPRSRARPGQPIALAVDTDRLYVFDPTTEDAIGWPAER
jgi:multiple sugar transport system ATP-binding protein